MNKRYRNVFVECGYSMKDVESRVQETFQDIFYGENRFYFEGEEETGYLVDTGNDDVRTEGMSYGMMMCVQLDKKKEFDHIWKWAKTYMYMSEGENSGYFAWSVKRDGTKNSLGPAPDGEEFFAMSLIFASHRWGDGEGIFNYLEEAKSLLHSCVHKGEHGDGKPMWNPDNKLIKFVPELEFTDPSYHLPHFYELFAEYGNEEDKEFWKEAAKQSRVFLQKACHPETGLSPEYSYYSGKPYEKMQDIFGRHDWYYSDAYRTIANIALDYEWFPEKSDGWHQDIANRLQTFFCDTVKDNNHAVYAIDGDIIEKCALHPVAMTAVNAQASLGADGQYAKQCVEEFWNTPLRTGERRYYDNCLYMFAMLALSGNYRMW